MSVSEKVNKQYKQDILGTMAADKIRHVVTHDDPIVLFGQKLYPKCANQPHQHQYVKQKVRELGRCLLSVRNKTPAVQTLQDCIDPTQFQHVISAVKEMCGFEGEVGKSRLPHLL